jgi:adhesin transport system outer membrane protein
MNLLLRWAGMLVVTLAVTACSTRSLPDYAPALPWQPPPLTVWKPVPWPYPPVMPAADVPASYLVLLPNADGTTGRVMFQGQQGRQTLSQAKQGADVAGPSTPFAVTDQQINRDFGAAMAARPTLPERYRLSFAPGKSDLTSEAQALLHTIVERSQHFTHLEVTVQGHTDRRGTAQANQALGLKRAQAIAGQLVGMGLRAVSLDVVSEGERLPLLPTPDEVAEPRNRRVEISLR